MRPLTYACEPMFGKPKLQRPCKAVKKLQCYFCTFLMEEDELSECPECHKRFCSDCCDADQEQELEPFCSNCNASIYSDDDDDDGGSVS